MRFPSSFTTCDVFLRLSLCTCTVFLSYIILAGPFSDFDFLSSLNHFLDLAFYTTPVFSNV